MLRSAVIIPFPKAKAPRAVGGTIVITGVHMDAAQTRPAKLRWVDEIDSFADFPPAPAPTLTPRQRMENLFLKRAAEARDPDARRILQNQADWIALSMRTSQIHLTPLDDLEPLTPATPDDLPGDVTDACPTASLLEGGYEPRRRAICLTPWILGLVATAALIAAMPAWWV